MQIKQMGNEANFARHAAPAASPNGDASPAQLDAARDAALGAALDAGDRAAALTLIDERYGESLHRFIHALVRRDDLADDLYQTTLLQAFRDLASFEERSSLRTWLFGIARHRCLDALKADRRRGERFLSGDDPDPSAGAVDDAPSALDRLGQAELVAALGHCLDELTAETRMVLLMRFSEDMPYDDIARVCRASAETLRARVSRALPILRRCVEQKGRA